LRNVAARDRQIDGCVQGYILEDEKKVKETQRQDMIIRKENIKTRPAKLVPAPLSL